MEPGTKKKKIDPKLERARELIEVINYNILDAIEALRSNKPVAAFEEVLEIYKLIEDYTEECNH